jgi:DNA-binding transcriptional LysR family regulator
MDRLQAMQVFVRVAQLAGFAAAARELGLSPAAVSKQVGALEDRLGARLLDRTTRQVGLTEAGRLYLEHCLECLQAVEDADAAVDLLRRAAVGQLRVSAPIDFCDPLVPVLAAVMKANADLTIDLRLSNRVVEMVEEGVDVSLRVARSLDGSFVARPIARTRLMLVGSADYLRRHGEPRTPQDLTAHRSLVFTEPRPLTELPFKRSDERVVVPLTAGMLSNHGPALVAAALHGLGLLVVPTSCCRPASRRARCGRCSPTGPCPPSPSSPATRTGGSSRRSCASSSRR